MPLLAEGFDRDKARGLYGALKGMHTSMSACHRGGTTRMRGWELEVESSMVDESSRRSRAVCRFDSETLNHKHEAQFREVTITSSWRTSRANAEMDLNAIQSAFSQGGLEAALRSAAPKDATAAATRASAQRDNAASVDMERPPGYFGNSDLPQCSASSRLLPGGQAGLPSTILQSARRSKHPASTTQPPSRLDRSGSRRDLLCKESLQLWGYAWEPAWGPEIAISMQTGGLDCEVSRVLTDTNWFCIGGVGTDSPWP